MKVILMKKKELESLMNEYDDLGIEVIRGYLFEKYTRGIRYIENLIEEKWNYTFHILDTLSRLHQRS